MDEILSLTSDIAVLNDNELTEAHQHYLHEATSANTRRAYQSAVRQFERWGGLLPADESMIIRYLLAQAERVNPRTLDLHLTALSHWHQYQNLPDPTQKPAIRKTLKGIQRVHGKPKQKAKALKVEELQKMVRVLEERGDLKSVRDNALIQVGFFGAFRCGELVNLRVDDCRFESEGLLIMLPKSKTDQEGQGKVKALPRGQKGLCPLAALRNWLEEASITEGVIFRRISRWGELGDKALHTSSVNLILKALGQDCDFDFIDELSSHSLRRGLATSAARSGADFDAIKRQGGWRSDGTVREYIEEGRLFEDNAVLSLLRYNVLNKIE